MDEEAPEFDEEAIEREMLEQELSSKYAAQRDEDDDDADDFPFEEEPPPSSEDEDEEALAAAGIAPKLHAQVASQQNDRRSTSNQTNNEKETFGVTLNESKRDARTAATASRYAHEVETKPYDEYFLKYPLLGSRQTTVTLGNGERRFCAIGTASERNASSISRRAVAENKWLTKIDPKLFSKIESEVEVKLAVESKVAEAVEAAGGSLKRKTQLVGRDLEGEKVPLVQRFMPRRFIDLLSHEKKNRDALKWLKSFDNLPAPPDSSSPQFPKPKILLLAGPPGSGKTTMAHVLARHAGYRVVEINASDERNAVGLKEKLASATEMKSVFDHDGRHNLVVLDEIDGISDGVQAVVQYALSPANARPLVCTCNDAYAPALRPLRRISLVLNIALPSRARLVRRMREICQAENVDYRPGALEMLVGRMDDDVRASLNALDFWMRSYRFKEIGPMESTESGRPRLILDVESVSKLPTFEKDGTADLWATWKQILHRQSNSKNGGRGLAGKRGDTNGGDLLGSVSRHVGDLDLVVDGIHENFLRNKFTDPSFTKTFKACEWLSFVDVMQTRTLKEMDFSFTSYCAAGIVGAGRAVSGGNAGRMVFPSSASAFRHARMRNQEALSAFFENPLTRSLNKREFATETVTMLLHMLVPQVRPIPVQALSAEEKREIERTVQIMNEFGLYWMDQPDSSISSIRMDLTGGLWSLDPAVDKLATFANQRTAGLVTAEMARAINSKIKRWSPVGDGEAFRLVSASSNSKPTTVASNQQGKSEDIKQGTVDDEKAQMIKRPKLLPEEEEATTIKSKEAPSKPVFAVDHGPPVKRDFFGRIVQIKPRAVESEAGLSRRPSEPSVAAVRHDFTFRFNEGLTEAVRRTVKMQDLM